MSPQQPSDVPPIGDWEHLLAGKVTVVTGGGDGIGGAISRLFGWHGALVEVAEIDPERAGRIQDDVAAADGAIRTHVLDVRDAVAVDRFRAEVLDHHGRVDVLVNNVGDYRPLVRFPESDETSWQAMYEINLLQVIRVTHAFLQPMIDTGGGSIVNLHSVEAMRGYPGEPVYAAMKAAVAQFTRAIAAGYGREGIRANGIGVDLTQTPQVDYLTGGEAFDHLWESWAPVGRVGWPEDQARVALFLASDLSAFVTGQNIAADGGSLAQAGWFWSGTEGRFVNRPKGL